MNRIRNLTVVIVALAGVSVAQAGPIVMDFESLRVDSDEQVIIHGTSYSEDGFTLSVTCCEPVAGPQSTDLRTSGTLAPNFPGSTAMRGGKSNTLITLRASNGLPFNLLSIDLATADIEALGPTVVTFEGVRVGGRIVTQTFSHTDFLSLTKYIFSGFSRLESVSWFQSEGVGQNPTVAHQFDNIRAIAVPEPGTLALLTLGLFGMGLSRRRKKA